MNGPEHYRAAEQAVEESRRCTTAGQARMWLMKAEIHAKLAHTATMVGLCDEEENRHWREVLGETAGQEAPGPAGDTCGSWADGGRCILRPGHDEPCLPYRVPAVVNFAGPEATAAPLPAPCAEYITQVPYGPCTMCGRTKEAHRLAAAPQARASRDDGDLGLALP